MLYESEISNSFQKVWKFTKYIRYIQEQDDDVLIVLSGRKGIGKSSFWLVVLLIYLKKYGLECNNCHHKWVFTGKTKGFPPPYFEPCPECKGQSIQGMTTFNLEKYVAFDNEEVSQRIRSLPAYSPLPCDEGVRFGMGEDWNVRENKDLKKLVAQCRPKHLILFICIPKLSWLDKKYRNDMVTFWVRLVKKGFAIILEPDMGENDDAFLLDDFQKILGSIFHRTPIEDLKRRCQILWNKHPPTFDYLSIPKPPKKLYKYYMILRNKKVFDEAKLEEAIDKKDLAKFLIYNLVNKWDSFSKFVNESRIKRPSFQVIRNYLMENPVSKEFACSSELVNKYFRQIDEKVKEEVSKKPKFRKKRKSLT